MNDAIRRGLVESVAPPRQIIEVPVFDLGTAMDENPWDVLAREDAARVQALAGPVDPNAPAP